MNQFVKECAILDKVQVPIVLPDGLSFFFLSELLKSICSLLVNGLLILCDNRLEMKVELISLQSISKKVYQTDLMLPYAGNECNQCLRKLIFFAH